MKKRWEIEEKDTWKLEDIIPGDQAGRRFMRRLPGR